MTNGPRAQSQQSGVPILQRIESLLEALRFSSDWEHWQNTRAELVLAVSAIADSIERRDAEIARLKTAWANDRSDLLKIGSEVLAECRAENAALAKLADELSVDHRDDDTFDAGVRYALFILGFEKEAVEANDASKALRAGQQKGEHRG